VAVPSIVELVPHRPPMLLIDEIVSLEGRTIVCRSQIREDHPFLRDGLVPNLIVIELFAQSAAALIGQFAPAGGPRLTSGALLGTRSVKLYADALALGDEVEIRCSEAWTIDMAAQIECTMYRRGEKIAEGSINVMAGEPKGMSRRGTKA
jgi:predicted hotdog family 3-hydroxylacyl-ACP dehydratase